MAESKPESDFFEEIKEREQNVFAEALGEARETVLKNRFSSLENITVEEFQEYEKLLDSCVVFYHFLLGAFWKHLPSPLEKEEKTGRFAWEVYLSGARHFATRYPKSYFRQLVGLTQFGRVPEAIDAYLEKCRDMLADLLDLSVQIKDYAANYNRGRNITRQYTPEGEDEGMENLSRLYGYLKTWSDDEKQSVFHKALEKSGIEIFELIIEGPIQLYLYIGKENWFFILKGLTVGGLSDFLSQREKLEARDLESLNDFIFNIIVNSEAYECFRQLGKETVGIYLENFQKQAIVLRRHFPTAELKERFIRRFEEGLIFQ